MKVLAQNANRAVCLMRSWSLICALCLSGSSFLLNLIKIPSCVCSAEEQVHEEAAQRCWSFQCSRWRSGLPGQSFCGLCEAAAGCHVGGADWSACAHQVLAFIPQSQGGKYSSGGGCSVQKEAFIKPIEKVYVFLYVIFVIVFPRFLFILLGPKGKANSYHEIGRAIATLMSDEVCTD